MSDWDTRAAKARGRMRKFIALANDKFASDNERQQARKHIERLSREYNIDPAEVAPMTKVVATPQARADTVRKYAGLFAGIQRAYPGIDSEDYSKQKDKE